MAISVVSKQGKIVIPAMLRQKYGWQPGTRLAIVDYGGMVTLIPVAENAVTAACGMLKGGSSLIPSLHNEYERQSHSSS